MGSTQGSPTKSNKLQMNAQKGQNKDVTNQMFTNFSAGSTLNISTGIKDPGEVLPENSSEIETRNTSSNLLAVLMKDKSVQEYKIEMDASEENKCKDQVTPKPKEVSKTITNFSHNTDYEEKPSMIKQKIQSLYAVDKTSIPPPSKPQVPAFIRPPSQNVEKIIPPKYESVKVQPREPDYNVVTDLEDVEFVRRPRRISITSDKTSCIPSPSKPQAPKPNFSHAAIVRPTSQIVEKPKSPNYESVKVQPRNPEADHNVVSDMEDVDFVRRPRRMSRQSSKDLQ